MRRTPFLLALLAAPALSAQALPSALQARYDSAYVAWDAGEYPAALQHFGRLLTGPGAEAVRAPIALVTGERYVTHELARDGARLRWSPDGRLAAFTAGRTTRVVDVSGARPQPRFEITGGGLAFSPDGRRAAYFALTDTPEIRAATARADSLQAAGQLLPWQRQVQLVNRLEQEAARLVLRDLASGQEAALSLPELTARQVAFDDRGRVYVMATPRGDAGQTNVFEVTPGAPVRALTQGAGIKQGLALAPGVAVLMAGPATVVLLDLARGTSREFEGEMPALADDGTALVFVARAGGEYVLRHVRTAPDAAPTDVKRSARPIATPVLSPDGRRIAFAQQLRDDWDTYVIGADGAGEVRVTHEIQHDRFPRWLGNTRVLAMKGEPRHTRAHVYAVPDSATAEVYEERLFHNNTVRTVAPEYEWAVSPDGARVLVVADRDGDTISPERGVYVVDLTREVPLADVRARVQAQLAAEQSLRARGDAMFARLDGAVRAVTEQVSTTRIYGHERALYRFDSKFITRPGNRRAIDYLAAQVRAMGYEPELQWFEPRPGVRTANVIATLRGTANPDLVYVVSSHFDSVEGGPGADDNTTGTAALLEAARVLARHPQRATIQFAWFTGEEAGLLGAREYVRRAVAEGTRIVGALNNDMVGWSNDHRLDNTIRYSNDGIRDLQHAAARRYAGMITYDARYYRNTDAHAYYEAYGDIVGGIGSYPILGNPHYHQAHDLLETINHPLVAAVSKTTVATLMHLASSPSRLTGLAVTGQGDRKEATWTPAVEAGVTGYRVQYGPPENPAARTLNVSTPRATLPGAGPGTVVQVKAVGAHGQESWDWARVVVR